MTARNSLERVLAILEVFTEDRLEWTPDQLMEELGYSRPTLYRYLKTLKEAGLLVSMPHAGFTLGPKVVEMDYLLRKSDRLVMTASPFLAAIAERYPCTVLLVRWYGDKLLCVDSAVSADSPQSSYPRGRPMPLIRGAIARVIMAFLPRRRLVPLVNRNLEELSAIGLGETSAAVMQSLRQVRKAGFASARGEVTPGVVAVAAPIFDASRTPIASISVTAAEYRVDEFVFDHIRDDVMHAAGAISASLVEHRALAEGRELAAAPALNGR